MRPLSGKAHTRVSIGNAVVWIVLIILAGIAMVKRG